MVSRQTFVCLALAFTLVFAGCGANVGANNSSGPNTTDTVTLTATTTVSNATPSVNTSAPLIASVTVNGTDANGDGAFETFALHVRANTTLPHTDPSGDNPGEPFFAVMLDGERLTRSPQVPHEENGTFVVEVNDSALEGVPAGDLTLTLALMDYDLLFDDRIGTTSIRVPYAPDASPTQTPTETTTRTATATLVPRKSVTTTLTRTTTITASPTATATVTPTTTETPTPTTTTTATPTATATATATATETPLPASSSISGGTARTATVTRVIDGDTLEVSFTSGETDTVRLIGVDTPEVAEQYMDPSEYGVPDTPRGRDWLLMWGDRASAYASERLAGQQVRVVTDPQSDERGGFGRLLAYIYVDGENFGRSLLERGLARVYTDGDFSLENAYLRSEADAQAAERGLWSFESMATATPIPDNGGGGMVSPTPSGGADDPYDCSDFDTHAQAQQWFENHNPEQDPAGLDGDGNGEACESLP